MNFHQIIELFKKGVVKISYANHKNVVQETDGTLNMDLIPSHLHGFDIMTRSTIKFYCLRTKSLKSFYPSKYFRLISFNDEPIQQTNAELNKTLTSLLTKSIVTFEYLTDSGNNRLAIGTLLPEYLINKTPYKIEHLTNENSTTQRYYDLQKGAIRSYHKRNLIRIF